MRGHRQIGLIADTHGLLRPEAVRALEGSDLILHAGDVGKPEVLEELRKVAPVIAVRGNVDKGAWASQLPLTATVETDSARIYMLHDVHELDIDPAAAGFQIVMSGHSHKASHEGRGGVLFVNPRQRRSTAFSIADHPWRAWICARCRARSHSSNSSARRRSTWEDRRPDLSSRARCCPGRVADCPQPPPFSDLPGQ
ncbi:MAG: metallophosphoesterase family protein [Ignavibacteriota bacterium]